MADAWMLSAADREAIGEREAAKMGGELVSTLVTSGLWFSIVVRWPNGVQRSVNVYDRDERGWLADRWYEVAR